MKTLVIIFSIVGLMTLNSCKQNSNVSGMLENSETRIELFDSIASNHNYMTEFMVNMQGNDHAMQMMQGNQKIMGNMMQGQGMQMMIKDSMMMKNFMNDSVMSTNIMHSMMKDGKMMNYMMQMMHNEGVMSDDCLKSSMNMMGDKGMNMGDMHNN